MAKRGRPFEPGNTFGKGRPRGSRNKTKSELRKALEEYSGPLLRKALADALKSGGPVLRFLLTHFMGPVEAMPVNIGALPAETAEDIAKASQTILEKTTKGKMTVQQAQGLGTLLELRRRAIETEQLEKRLRALELKNEPSAA